MKDFIELLKLAKIDIIDNSKKDKIIDDIEKNIKEEYLNCQPEMFKNISKSIRNIINNPTTKEEEETYLEVFSAFTSIYNEWKKENDKKVLEQRYPQIEITGEISACGRRREKNKHNLFD